MCCCQPDKRAQFLIFLGIISLGLLLSFLCGCFANGADIKMALGSYLIAANILTFVMFVFDKSQAVRDGWRVSEIALYFLIFAGGPLGGWLGMFCANHKSSKKEFLIRAAIATVFNLAWVLIWLIITARDNLPKCYEKHH